MTDFSSHDHDNTTTIANFSTKENQNDKISSSTGFSQTQDQNLTNALDQAISSQSSNDHNHEKPQDAGKFSFHVDDLSQVKGVKQLNNVAQEFSLSEHIGFGGTLQDAGGGTNIMIGTKHPDIFFGNRGGFNTITAGPGGDSIILGAETTNRIFDFEVEKDRLIFDKSLDPNNIVIAQGQNPGKGGIDQPLDSVNNTLVIDKASGHILATLNFTKVDQLDVQRNFKVLTDSALQTLETLKFDDVQQGNGQLNSKGGKTKMTGGDGDDFLVGTELNKVAFNTAKGGGGTEFPFPTDSRGTSEINVKLNKEGVLNISGSYQNFDGFPLFSQGEKTIDPKAKILNGSDPVALVNGFLKVPNDVEGNPISGTHLHFSPSGDTRGNFADATVIRYLQDTPQDAKSGKLSGEFHLTPVEQAALLAGNLYINIHTNIDGDGDGRAGFPTGENRININRDIVQF